MKTHQYALTFLYTSLAIVGLCSSACKSNFSDRPESALQRALASKLTNPEMCPNGGSQDIQQIVNAASSNEIAQLPEGCYEIKTTVTISVCTRLFGAGANKTILYRDPQGNYSQPMIRVKGGQETGCVTQISGLSLVGVRNTDDTGQDYGVVITNIKDFRIDHSYFEGFGFAGVRVEGDSTGVIDHSIFVDNFKRGIDNLGYGVVVYGKGYWEDNFQPGGAQATFVEDSIFTGNRHAIAANAGAHYIFRNNQVLHNVQACSVDAHGMGYGSAHGTQYVEIYRNILQNPEYDECGIGIRGGAGVIFENTIIGYRIPILLILEWGTPDIYKKEYPALDQIHGLYIWGNRNKGGQVDPQVDQTGIGFIELGRDYFTEPLAGYVPYTYSHPLARGGPFDEESWPPTFSQ